MHVKSAIQSYHIQSSPNSEKNVKEMANHNFTRRKTRNNSAVARSKKFDNFTVITFKLPCAYHTPVFVDISARKSKMGTSGYEIERLACQ